MAIGKNDSKVKVEIDGREIEQTHILYLSIGRIERGIKLN